MRIRKDLQYYRKDETSRQGYRYEGEYFAAPVDAAQLQGVKVLLSAASLIQAALVFLMGWLNSPSSRVLYAMIPYLGLVYAAGRCLWAAGHLFTWQNRMTIRQNRVSWKALQDFSMISAAAGAIYGLALGVFILWGGGSIAAEGKQLILCLAQASIALPMHFIMK